MDYFFYLKKVSFLKNENLENQQKSLYIYMYIYLTK